VVEVKEGGEGRMKKDERRQKQAGESPDPGWPKVRGKKEHTNCGR